MPSLLTSAFGQGPDVHPVSVLIGLLSALALGAVVAWIHRRTDHDHHPGMSFPITLVMLAVLIAMVTQVIGDSIARAFSLVGALSIVRFRTVVRDTKDTAYVIFAVVVGMAVGAQNLWVAGIGIAVIGTGAVLVSLRGRLSNGVEPVYLLTARVAAEGDPEARLGQALEGRLNGREVVAVNLAKHGTVLDIVYQGRLRPGVTAQSVVQELSRLEGVEDLRLKRGTFEKD
jgi:hypothetical protein